MCGIAGYFSTKEVSTAITAATTTLAHRGPDGEGYFTNKENTVALGHRRLCVIDVEERAAQPMCYHNRYYIVHNGELYNYIEIKRTLLQKGHTFNTESDTEVIVAAYHAYGQNCLQHFDGMFSFAIWDNQEQVLFAARDRFGEKPFFYFYDGHVFSFASEIKGLWQMGVAKEVNPAMLYNYLTIGYTSNPFNAEETFYKNISKLPAASFLMYDLKNHSLIIEKYWRVDTTVNHTITDAEAIEKFTQLFHASIKNRLRSDVAIGTSLSGGLDSSSIVAFCSEQPSQQYSHTCFTATFPHFNKSEEQYATAVANRFHLKQQLVQVTEKDFIADIDKILWHQEEPVISASVVAQYKVYEAAKKSGITVLLDGQGADEILGGYSKYYKWHWQELYRNKGLQKSGELGAAKALGVKEAFNLKNKMAALFPHFAASLMQSNKARQAYKGHDLHADFVFANKRDLYYAMPLEPNLNGALYFNTFLYGLEELLRYADRNSMAHGVEVRLPFLSHQLVQFLFSLPPNLKIRNGWTKWLLRTSVNGLLPDNITWRKDKVGFEPPQKAWMMHPQIQEMVQEGKRKLVDNGVLRATALNRKIMPLEANAANNIDWRYLSSTVLW